VCVLIYQIIKALRKRIVMSKNKRGLIVFICLSVALTLLDILVVEIVYRPTSDWDNIYKYHIIYLTLIVALPLITTYKLCNLMPMATWIFFLFGLEDTLFYGLQGYLPKIYWGVYVCGIWEATLNQVIVINTIGIILIAVYIIAVVKLNKILGRWV